MTEGVNTHPRAFVVRFKDLKSWSVGSLRELDWSWPADQIKPLSAALTRQVEVLEEQNPSIPPITIRFDGSISPRDVGTRQLKGKLFKASAGDVVFSKIDLRNGAIGIVPENLPNVAVTNEFPVYRVNTTLAHPEYVQLLVQSGTFRRYINGMVSGASGRKRVTPDQLEQIEVPLPALAAQRAIVERWQHGQKQARELEEEAPILEREVLTEVSRILGKLRISQVKPRAFVLPWVLLDQWGFESALRAKGTSTEASFPEVTIDQICKISSGGTPSRHRKDYFGGLVPWVKTTEVRDGIIYETEEGLTESGVKNSSAKIYPVGSLLIAMYGQGATRGRTARLGIEAATNQACAALTGFDSRIEPDYLWVYLMSEYEHLRALASGNNQPNLNAGMIANYPLPLPPLDIQRDIVQRVAQARAEAGRLREAARQVRDETRADVEAMILGTKAVVIA